MPISESLKRIYATAPTDDYYIETLSLEHPNFLEGTKYITNQMSGLSGKLEDNSDVTYQFLPFAAVPPRSEEEGNMTLQVAIDNADRQLMEELERLAESPTQAIIVKYRVYLASDPNTVQNDPPLKLDILGVTATKATLTFSAGLANLRQRPFPSMLYTVDRYPGLNR